MIKIIGGDKSDNIPPIANRLGKNKILELSQSQEKLNEFLKIQMMKLKIDLIQIKKLLIYLLYQMIYKIKLLIVMSVFNNYFNSIFCNSV